MCLSDLACVVGTNKASIIYTDVSETEIHISLLRITYNLKELIPFLLAVKFDFTAILRVYSLPLLIAHENFFGRKV